jgi:outer membrane protein assembly factor BamB
VEADLGSPVVGQPAIGRDGTLYVTTEGGDLYAFAR